MGGALRGWCPRACGTHRERNHPGDNSQSQNPAWRLSDCASSCQIRTICPAAAGCAPTTTVTMRSGLQLALEGGADVGRADPGHALGPVRQIVQRQAVPGDVGDVGQQLALPSSRSAKPPIRLSCAALSSAAVGPGHKVGQHWRATATAASAWSGRVCRPMLKAPACSPGEKSLYAVAQAALSRTSLIRRRLKPPPPRMFGCPPAGKESGSLRL